MFADTANLISAYLSGVYNLLTSINFPGTSWSIFTLLTFATIFTVMLRVIYSLMDMSLVPVGRVSGWSTKEKKIAQNRKDDEK